MSVGARLEKLTPREQRLLTILGALVGAMFFLGVPFYLYSSVANARSDNAEIRGQIARMDKAAPLLAERREAREARDQLYGKAQVPLESFIESAARAQEIDVADTANQPDAHAKGFVEHSAQAKFRKVSLKALVNALEQMEKSGMPIAITSLHITARSQPDEYDVTLTVSQYEKQAEGSDGKKPAASPKGKGQTL
jgi:type II secretory pathway component PulM